MKKFESCIAPVEYTRKIQRKDFLDDGQFPIVSQEAAFINGYWNDGHDVFKVKTPVVIFGDHTQVLKYVDFDFVLGADGVKILQPREFLHPKFLYYQLHAAEMPTLGYARHYRLLKELEIPVPLLAEQQRLVSILDEAFAGLATAQANAEKNLQNARALFESHLQSVFSQRGKEWQMVKLDELWLLTFAKQNRWRDWFAAVPFEDRGGYFQARYYQEISVQLGLTATLKRKENADTYAYFGEPVFTYSLNDGINDGFLTPFRVKQIQTTMDYYTFTSDDTVIEGEIEVGKVYDETDFNKTIEIKEREKKRVEIFMKMIDQREKTLVFCATQAHVLLVRDLKNHPSAF